MAEVFRIVPRERGPDIAAHLRELADQYDAEEAPTGLVFVAESDDGFRMGIFGHLDEIRACGLLTIGAQYMGQESTE